MTGSIGRRTATFKPCLVAGALAASAALILLNTNYFANATAITVTTTPTPTPAANDTVADRVLGEPDFTHGLGLGCNQGTPNSPTVSSLCDPIAVAVDAAGHLYVADADT